jgi:hypothetical protein
MRIRIFQAFASNNSGAYTIVGSFKSMQAAEEVAALLKAICAEHDAWREEHDYDAESESPLDRFKREHGLTEDEPGRHDDWPEYGAAPTVLAVGYQVLLHAPRTVTMPRLFGEFFYKRGGRVNEELDHSHEQLAVEIDFSTPDLQWNDPQRATRLQAVKRDLAEPLRALACRKSYDDRPTIEPVFCATDWGGQQLAVVFDDLVEGVEVVRSIAARNRVQLSIRIRECPHGVADPFAPLRARAHDDPKP